MCEGICVICGKHFEYQKGNKITCSKECMAERQRRYSRERDRKRQELNKKKKAKPKHKSTLGEDAKEAKNIGMSYGQYIAKKEGR